MIKENDSELGGVVAVMGWVMSRFLAFSVAALLFMSQYEGVRDGQLWGGAKWLLVTALVSCFCALFLLRLFEKNGAKSSRAIEIGGGFVACGLGVSAAGFVQLLMSLDATLGGVAYLSIMISLLLICWALVDIQRSRVETDS